MGVNEKWGRCKMSNSRGRLQLLEKSKKRKGGKDHCRIPHLREDQLSHQGTSQTSER